MKNKLSMTLATLLCGSVAFSAPTLEERVAELEAQNSLNIFNFSGTLNSRYDQLEVKQTNPSSINVDGLNYLRMRFSLNVDANVSKNIKVYSRFTTTKMMNSWRQQGTGLISSSGTDLKASDNYSNSNVVLEKAYADVTIPDTNFVFSMGRFPTTDGQPGNYWDGKARQGTYPLMSYGSVLDGFALTYRLDQYLPKGNTLALRALYTPFVDANMSSFQTPPTADGTTTAQSGLKTNSLKQFYTQQIDYSSTNLGFAENVNVILQHYSLLQLEFANGSATASNLDVDIDSSSLAIDMQGLFGTSFDASISELVTAVKSRGFYNAAPYATSGFGTTLAEDTTYGSTTLLSLRYRMNSWIFGGEYLAGKKGVFYSGNTAEDLTNFYGTPGNAYHLYVTKKFSENLALRIGTYNQDEKYTRLGLGNITENDKKINTYYANIRLDF